QSGGHIDVSTRRGQGTSFVIELPRIAGEVDAASAAPGEAPRGTETVLLAEDEEPLRRVVRRLLVGLGYTVLEAGGGEEALRIAEALGRPIDLLLTDLVMPGMGGRELAAALRARLPRLRVLYITGYAPDGDGA